MCNLPGWQPPPSVWGHVSCAFPSPGDVDNHSHVCLPPRWCFRSHVTFIPFNHCMAIYSVWNVIAPQETLNGDFREAHPLLSIIVMGPFDCSQGCTRPSHPHSTSESHIVLFFLVGSKKKIQPHSFLFQECFLSLHFSSHPYRGGGSRYLSF